MLSRVVNILPITRSDVSESAILGSRLLDSIAPYSDLLSDQGSMIINLNATTEPHTMLASTDCKVLRGLPAIGFWASIIVNSHAIDGVLANYAFM